MKLLAEAALQAEKDKESRNRLIVVILGPVISLLLLVALTMYLATSPFSVLSEWLVGDETAAVDGFQKDYGYNNDSGIFERDFWEADGQEYDEDILLGRDHFISKDFTEMTSRLGYLKDIRGIGVFTARPGMGKSYCLRCFAKSLNPSLFHMEYLCLSTISVADFYKQLCAYKCQHQNVHF